MTNRPRRLLSPEQEQLVLTMCNEDYARSEILAKFPHLTKRQMCKIIQRLRNKKLIVYAGRHTLSKTAIKQILFLREQGHTFEQIAQRMQVSIWTVRTTVRASKENNK